MEYLTFLVLTVFFIIITVPAILFVFGFFGVPLESYGNYVLWFVALALFNALLPFSKKNIFEKLKPKK